MENKLSNLITKVAIGKDISMYRDEDNGFIIPYSTASMIASCKKVLLTDEIIKKLVEDKIFDSTDSYEIEIQTRKIPHPTKPNTITDEEFNGYIAWEVKNAIGVEYFNNKEEAIRKVDEINDRINEMS